MNKPNKSPWWASMRFRQSDPSGPDTDYANMGTAFGLDASLRMDGEVPPVAGEDAGPVIDRLNRRSVI